MSYRVLIQPSAADGLDAAYRWIAGESPDHAAAWLHGAIEAIRSLSEFPRRCPLAPENDAFEVEIRQLLYSRFRILFTVQDNDVRILHVRHAARRYLNPEEQQ